MACCEDAAGWLLRVRPMLPASKSCRAPVENVGAPDPTADSGEGPGTHGLHAAAWGLAGTRQQPLSTLQLSHAVENMKGPRPRLCVKKC